MARVSPGIMGIQGTINNMVFVRRQSKAYVRKVQEPGLGKKRPQIMKTGKSYGRVKPSWKPDP